MKPDWNVWRDALKATLRDAVCLSCDTDPKVVALSKAENIAAQLFSLPVANKEVCSEIERRLAIARSHAGTGGTLSTVAGGDDGDVYLATFAEWALNARKWTVPDELRALASMARPTSGPPEQTTENASKDVRFIGLDAAAFYFAQVRWADDTPDETALDVLNRYGAKPGSYTPLYALRVLTAAELQRQIDSLVKGRKIVLYDLLSHTPTTDTVNAAVNRAELIRLLDEGAYLDAEPALQTPGSAPQDGIEHDQATDAPAGGGNVFPRMKIGRNSVESMRAYVEYRSREIYRAGEATTREAISEILVVEMGPKPDGKGYSGTLGEYWDAKTINKALPRGVTGGYARNGRKS